MMYMLRLVRAIDYLVVDRQSQLCKKNKEDKEQTNRDCKESKYFKQKLLVHTCISNVGSVVDIVSII